jgi:hypothetical protein
MSAQTGASFNSNGRTELFRKWNDKRTLNIIMYYPSTADEKKDDVTIKRCIEIAKYNDYGSIQVYNIHNDVKDLTRIRSDIIVIAWGNKISVNKSQNLINELKNKYTLLCFGKVNNGNPTLPTRLPYSTKLKLY